MSEEVESEKTDCPKCGSPHMTMEELQTMGCSTCGWVVAIEVAPEPEPRLFEHDCEECLWLGTYRGNDLYYHPGDNQTVIARFGDDGPDYHSGLEIAKAVQAALDLDEDLYEPPEGSLHALAVAAMRSKHLIGRQAALDMARRVASNETS